MKASQESVILKEKQVKELADQISKANTLMVASIKGLPSKQFQEIKKSIREHASVKVAKKNIMIRALKSIGKDSILELEKHIESDCAFVISDLDAFELAGILASKKTPVFAKSGQIAEDDIEVKEGPTDLVPGPAISELGALGLQVAVEDGKISIKKSKIVVNKGQVINEGAASLFQKLNIQPFEVGLNIKAAYDVEAEKIYKEIKIDAKGYIEELKTAACKALGLAQKIGYYCKETIGYFLAKANAEGEKLGGFFGDEEKVGEVEKDSNERDKGESEEVKETENTSSENEGNSRDGETIGSSESESKNSSKVDKTKDIDKVGSPEVVENIKNETVKGDNAQLNEPEESA